MSAQPVAVTDTRVEYPDGLLSVRGFRPHKLAFTQADDGYFVHNYDRDLHLFVIWEPARHAQDEILAELDGAFRILHVAEVLWRDEIAQTAFSRLYKTPNSLRVGLPDKVGTGGAFLVVVVEDLQSRYGFHQAPQSLALANLVVVGLKARFRDRVGGFLVHSSGTPREFFEQAPLLLGLDRLQRVLDGHIWDGQIERIREDPPGSEGWRDLPELFAFLTATTNWLLLRGGEDLPRVPPSDREFDLDVLCDDLDGFIAAANAASGGIPSRRHKCEVTVAGLPMRIDVRTVGDNYYDAQWQADMLRRQTMSDKGVPQPRTDDYFFSLLCHAKMHKSSVDEGRLRLLAELASTIGLADMSADALRSDEQAAALICGFMAATGYRATLPRDRGVTINRSMLRLLRPVLVRKSSTSPGRMLADAYRSLPAGWRAAIPQAPKRRLKRLLNRGGAT